MRGEQDGELTRKMKNSNGERVSRNDQEPFHARCNESQRFVSIYSPSLFILYPLIFTLMLMLHIPEYIFRRKEKNEQSITGRQLCDHHLFKENITSRTYLQILYWKFAQVFQNSKLKKPVRMFTQEKPCLQIVYLECIWPWI